MYVTTQYFCRTYFLSNSVLRKVCDLDSVLWVWLHFRFPNPVKLWKIFLMSVFIVQIAIDSILLRNICKFKLSLQPRWWFSFISIGMIYIICSLTIMCWRSLMSCSGRETYMSDQGNPNNNGPHQDQSFDNSSVLCLALWGKTWGGGGGGGNDATRRLCMKRAGLFSSLHCLQISSTVTWHDHSQ